MRERAPGRRRLRTRSPRRRVRRPWLRAAGALLAVLVVVPVGACTLDPRVRATQGAAEVIAEFLRGYAIVESAEVSSLQGSPRDVWVYVELSDDAGAQETADMVTAVGPATADAFDEDTSTVGVTHRLAREGTQVTVSQSLGAEPEDAPFEEMIEVAWDSVGGSAQTVGVNSAGVLVRRGESDRLPDDVVLVNPLTVEGGRYHEEMVVRGWDLSVVLPPGADISATPLEELMQALPDRTEGASGGSSTAPSGSPTGVSTGIAGSSGTAGTSSSGEGSEDEPDPDTYPTSGDFGGFVDVDFDGDQAGPRIEVGGLNVDGEPELPPSLTTPVLQVLDTCETQAGTAVSDLDLSAGILYGPRVELDCPAGSLAPDLSPDTWWEDPEGMQELAQELLDAAREP